MSNFLNPHKYQIQALCKKHNVKSLYAFGSVLRSDFNDKSDVDFLVEFEELEYGDYADNYFSLAETLEELLGKKVDLITDKSMKNPYFIDVIKANRQLLYAA